MKIMRVTAFLASILLTNTTHAQIGRDPKPQLYPNKHLQQVGKAQADKDLASCSTAASNYEQTSKQPGEGLRKGARSAAKGALLGTAGGAIAGNTGRGAAAGAVVGGSASVLRGISQRGAKDPVFQQYVNSCLEDKGYKVIEWK